MEGGIQRCGWLAGEARVGGCGVGGGDEDALGGVDDLGEVGGGWLGVGD